MGFSICDCKKLSGQVIQPRRRRHSSPSPDFSSSSKSNPFSSTSSSNFVLPSTASTSSFNRDSARSPVSTVSLRHSLLPEQAHVYSLPEITAATRGFLLPPYSSTSSSTAWRCQIRNQTAIIFQRSFRREMDTSQLVDRLSLICRSHHSSLVKLKGASISNSYIYLVYDYIAGANLSTCLRNSKNPNFTVLSNWMSRIRIASDIAHGLDYVHNSTGLGFEFVHNHIKSSSILIEEPLMNARICHFGTADLCGETLTTNPNLDSSGKVKRLNSKVKKFKGTRGYMAPEYQRTGIPTHKSDVYAFGVVILELLSAMEALEYQVNAISGAYVKISVVDAARHAVEGNAGVRQWLDKRLRDSYPVEVVERLVHLALDCVADDPAMRPDMSMVTTRVSQMFLESQRWYEGMGAEVTEFTVSLAPR